MKCQSCDYDAKFFVKGVPYCRRHAERWESFGYSKIRIKNASTDA